MSDLHFTQRIPKKNYRNKRTTEHKTYVAKKIKDQKDIIKELDSECTRETQGNL